MKIRAAVPGDVPAIMQIGHETWPATYAFAGAEYIAHGLANWWSREATERMLEFTSVLIAEDDAGPVGVGNVDLRAEAAVVWKLYVLPRAQGSGAGSALLRELVALAGDKPVRLAYADGNERAGRFYAAHGFRELRRDPSEHPGWPGYVWLQRSIDQIPGR
ncbi:GNAT family N-acetyltransferase [Paractinoplanes lichenicola]|uniref:GNAT family N-acetyltransferase n=1 Tax=Paractinoplanes lichenicola TaxID=2802976 RepID=A0ABS1VTN8_9ACTN|nr:GNAT family N-acetyltransferase [Actinoplanes lichenicola]MBL7257838.1 GNAT family N-acetyltransferase [Actinoplanes lichenicola]